MPKEHAWFFLIGFRPRPEIISSQVNDSAINAKKHFLTTKNFRELRKKYRGFLIAKGGRWFM